MQQDTPLNDRSARAIAENVYAAYMRQAEGGMHPQAEQTLVTRLAEAVRPVVALGAPGAVVDAANAVLDAWERQDDAVRGPRVVAIEGADGAARLAWSAPRDREAG